MNIILSFFVSMPGNKHWQGCGIHLPYLLIMILNIHLRAYIQFRGGCKGTHDCKLDTENSLPIYFLPIASILSWE